MNDFDNWTVDVQVLPHGEGLPLPAYAKQGDAGMDLRAAIPDDTAITIAPGARRVVPTGLAFALPTGHYGRIAPRSGLAATDGMDVLAGVVDASYRGEVAVLLVNLGQTPFVVLRGDRIAQLLICPVERVRLHRTLILPPSTRDTHGWGSTGTE